MAKPRHHIALVPGLFGFAKLGGFDYFMHVEEALETRFAEAGFECDFALVSSPPTGSIVRRAEVLLDTVELAWSDSDGPIHLIGHSTGGLDVRLFASPTTRPLTPEWFGRVRTAVTISTPHYGTPLAHDLATLPGRRLLLALWVLTFRTLRAGGYPRAGLAPLLAALGKVDDVFGLDIKILDRITDQLLGENDTRPQEVRDWFDRIRADRGAIIQLTPEAMDIFNAGVEDNPRVRYGSVVTRMPPPGPIKVAASVLTPAGALSVALFTTLYLGASNASKVYPSPRPGPEIEAYLEQSIGGPIEQSFNDGLVPTLSQVWGEVVWAGTADHLDILGHFKGQRGSGHTDWQVSGAGFDEAGFDDAMDAVADFLLRAKPRRG
ncbi:MAG: hypothetical protein WBG86_04670 [Polyangiales bacterium]